VKNLLIATTLTGALLLASPPLLWADQDCTEQLTNKCISCHYNTRICDKIGKKNRRAWQNTTKRMIRYGLKLADAEVEQITECLVDLEEKPGKFCD
jgi:hypothetical protein